MGEVHSVDWRQKESQEHLLDALDEALPALAKIEKSGTLDIPTLKVLVGLLQTTSFSYRNLLSGWKTETVAFMAWAARTLVECEIWMEYVTLSDANSKRFHDDWTIDVSEILSSSTPFSDMNPQQRSDMSILYPEAVQDPQRASEARKMLEGVIDSTGLEDEDYLRVSSVAKELGHQGWFSQYNKILSKYVHATALSVLSFPTEKARTNLSNLLLYNGSNSAIRVTGHLNAFLKQRSLPTIF